MWNFVFARKLLVQNVSYICLYDGKTQRNSIKFIQ